jgi:hypothetical protein
MEVSKKKNAIPIIILGLSGIILILGIWQLVLYIPPQLEMLADATTQGATAEQISDYFWQDLMPQVLNYVITILGFVSVLFAAGMLYRKHGTSKITMNSTPNQNINSKAIEVNSNLDDLFEEFDIVTKEQEQEN